LGDLKLILLIVLKTRCSNDSIIGRSSPYLRRGKKSS